MFWDTRGQKKDWEFKEDWELNANEREEKARAIDRYRDLQNDALSYQKNLPLRPSIPFAMFIVASSGIVLVLLAMILSDRPSSQTKKIANQAEYRIETVKQMIPPGTLLIYKKIAVPSSNLYLFDVVMAGGEKAILLVARELFEKYHSGDIVTKDLLQKIEKELQYY